MFSRITKQNGLLKGRLLHISKRLRSTQPQKFTDNVQDAVRYFRPGEKFHGYTVKKVSEVPELFLTTVTLHHDKTGAEHLHIARNDDNNAFSVLFRTTPMDSTGVPHILEHTVLCGSRKFPVRDPFFKMLNKSLATFMNAMTASDWTMYPFATQNKKDYNNLLSVYLDAVFYPELRELDFSQEGWRLEHADPQDQSSPITFKGVVYNEMKGVFSSQSNIFAEALQNQLLPSHTYGVVSGGDPAYIPDLTWEHLRNFHKTHYHPSNAKFYTYGNFPLEEHLEFINSNYLQNFDKIDINTQVPPEPRWTAPREHQITCHSDTMVPDPDKQTMVGVTFLLTDITDLSEATTLSIISALLTEGETSPFYQALIESNIGSDYTPVVGYAGYTKEGSFTVGLQGVHKNDVEKVKQIIKDTIDKVIREGFSASRIEAILHRTELSVKHQTTHFGVGVAMGSSYGWCHDGDAAEMLQVNKQVSDFRSKIDQDPKYLQNKVKQYLQDNPHSLTLVMSPDEKYEEKRRTQEEQKLQGCIEKLTDEDRQTVFQRGLDLQKVQNSVEDLSCLPCIQLQEIDRKIKPEPTQHDVLGGCPVQFSAQPTNEVTYVRMLSYLDQVPEEMKAYVPLFTNIITKMGAGIYDYMELSHQMELYTGGLSASTLVSSDPNDPVGFAQGVLFTSHCLERNLDKMFGLWTEIFDRVSLKDTNRLQTLIRMAAAELAMGLPQQGHAYAMQHSASSLNPAAKLEEQFSGISQVSVMKKIAESEDNSKTLEHLIEISQKVLNKDNLKLCVNATPGFMPTALQKMEGFLDSLKSDLKVGQSSPENHTVHAGRFEACPVNTQIQLPFTVNYMSKSVQTVPYCHPDYPILSVLTQLITWKYLHREIREKGGAYGGGARSTNGVFSFFSYRDPNSLKTLDVFDNSINWAASGEFSDKDVEEAKIAVFKGIDSPIAPGAVGKTLFMGGITDTMRQINRDRLFDVTKTSLINCVNRYLLPGTRPSSTSFLGPENPGIAENKNWKILKE